MEVRALQEMALRLSAFADALEKQMAQTASDAQHNTQAMARSAQVMTMQVDRLSHDAISAVRREGRAAVEAGLGEGIRPGVEQLNKTSRTLIEAANALHAQSQMLKRAHRSVTWMTGAALLTGALLAAGGSSYLVWKNHQELKRGEFARDILDATKSGALNRCGNQLCARVGSTPERYKDNGEYVLLR